MTSLPAEVSLAFIDSSRRRDVDPERAPDVAVLARLALWLVDVSAAAAFAPTAPGANGAHDATRPEPSR